MSDPLRVLQVFSTLDRGGAEQVVMNWYRAIDRSKIQFDFAVEDNGRKYAHEAEVLRLGGRIYRVPPPLPNTPSYLKRWSQLLDSHPEWRVVHAHHTSPAAIFLSIARFKGRRTIAHSHTAGGNGRVKGVAKRISRWPLKYIATDLMACSSEAATWMFGRSSVEVLPNGIDSESFRYSKERSESIRTQLRLGDSFVVGHVGSFRKVKNHRRILEIFKQILNRSPAARLVLVGDGQMRREIEEYSHTLDIRSQVEFLGVRSDVSELLGVFDVLLFPSLYEGLPVSLIEAQASGLPIVMSETISREVILTDLVSVLPLSAGDAEWAQRTLDAASAMGSRGEQCDVVKRSGFQIDRSVERIERLYGEIR